MEENKPQETIDPRDLNGDGKVTLSEKIQYAAGQAAEKAKVVYSEAKERGRWKGRREEQRGRRKGG